MADAVHGDVLARVAICATPFGQRLRQAAVVKEDRALLLGHAVEDMPEHYATSTIERLVKAANKVQRMVDRTTLLRAVNG